jgi:TRAP-type C4-dicarboxylate transport system permease large subunit
VASGAIAAVAVVYLFGAGLLAGLLAYSFGGAICTLVAAWFRFRCVEREEQAKAEKFVAAQ